MDFFRELEQKWRFLLVPVLLLGDLFINIVMLRFVNYTEIDWIAYMQEVEGVVDHQNFNYSQLKGDTGPLVYPGGFVAVFSFMRYITSNGTNIFLAQMIFALFHTIIVFLVSLTLRKISKTESIVPVWVYVLLISSRRVHSIFGLRLFNDGIAMLLMYFSIYLLISRKFFSSVLLFSFASSIKMNVIMFLPGLAVVLIRERSFLFSTIYGLIFIVVHLLVGFPFLLTDAKAYLSRSVDVNRVFMHEWTVNYKFLPEDLFQSKNLSLLLTFCTLSCWLLFGEFRWSRKGLFRMVVENFVPSQVSKNKSLKGEEILEILLVSNFIGIVFFRSLHYQFYSWYFHSLGYLIWRSRVHLLLGFALIAAIELSFNVFPATPWSSALLQLSHLIILYKLWTRKDEKSENEAKKDE